MDKKQIIVEIEKRVKETDYSYQYCKREYGEDAKHTLAYLYEWYAYHFCLKLLTEK